VRCLVVIPTYQEAGNVEEVIHRTRAALAKGEVLIVDDASPDGTADRAEALAARTSGVSVLRRQAKEGLGAAYRAGFSWGLERGFEVLVEMDADLQHDPAALPDLLRRVEDGADLVIGSRYVEGGAIPSWSWHRRALSRYGNCYAALVLGLPVTDATSGFRAYDANALRLLDTSAFRADGYSFQIETAYRVSQAGGRIVELPITFGDRAVGESKMSWRIVVEALVLVTWWAARDRLLRPALARWLGRRTKGGGPLAPTSRGVPPDPPPAP
jgi:glycosyltransferase involved in cell wall biosynthesis